MPTKSIPRESCVSDCQPRACLFWKPTTQKHRYVYGKDNEFWDDMRANGVTRERFFLYNMLGLAVALGGNLFGITSGLLGTVAPDASRDLRVDLLFPIGGFKRCGVEGIRG